MSARMTVEQIESAVRNLPAAERLLLAARIVADAARTADVQTPRRVDSAPVSERPLYKGEVSAAETSQEIMRAFDRRR